MRQYTISLLCLLILSCTSSRNSIEKNNLTSDVVIKNVTIVDVENGTLLKSKDVFISGEIISNISNHSSGKLNAQTIVDGTNKFLIPGLWDMHVHLFNNISKGGTDNHENYFPLFITNGITGVRDMWTDPEDIKVVHQWKQQIAAGSLIGPHVAIGSSIVDGVPTYWPNALGVSTPEEGRKAVRKLKDAGAGFIKVYWNLSPETYYAIAEESKKLRIDFAGHVPFSISAKDASNAGQKSIEHLTGIAETCSSKEEELRKQKFSPAIAEEMMKTYDESKCMALYKVFAKNNTWHTPTSVMHRGRVFGDQKQISADERLQYMPSEEVQGWKNAWNLRKNIPEVAVRQPRFQMLLDAINKMHRIGVPLLAGTDLGNPFVIAGYSLHDELQLFVQAGLTPLQALQTATINPAKYFNKTDSFGTVTNNKRADMILLAANPLEDITNTRRIETVFLNGRIYNTAELDKLKGSVLKMLEKK